MKKLLIAVAICLSSTQIGLCVDVVAPQTPSVTAGTTNPKEAALRVGDIAPQFSLPDLNGKLWNSRDQLGHHSILLFTDGDYPTLTFTLTKKEVTQAAEQIGKGNIITVLAASNGITTKENAPAFTNFIVLHDRQHSLQSAISYPALIAIDRAGFVRATEKILDISETGLSSLMLRIGDPTPKLEVGKVAPDFSIPDMNGIVRRVSDLRGKRNLLLTFFPKCFTGGCTNHLTSIQREYLSYIASDTEVWAVSVDEAKGDKGQLAFAARWNLQFPLIPDVGRNLSILYGAAKSPDQLASRMSVLIDKDGIVRLIDREVDVHTHGADIVTQMRRMNIIKTP